jgi:hypothetical protein
LGWRGAIARILSTRIIHNQFIARFAHNRVAFKRPDVLYDYRTRMQEASPAPKHSRFLSVKPGKVLQLSHDIGMTAL